ncbi:cytochrome C oxidase subunit IV family protein [Exiguobacterium flavidum]|uniref:cytochrome C oxidase subunit IV family protein n=1 Tax=Exiguobacterium flavidum TaxID=2184695 RepID=UPI000DF7724E|nr:cytochrome C oxidase subunit IV family protein [Exiguobacterium flavidum]
MEKHEPQLTRKQMELEMKADHSREMQVQLISFALMIFLTLIAFGAVMAELMPRWAAGGFLVIMAIVQVYLQLYMFMHMNNKGNTWIKVMMGLGIFVALTIVATLRLLIW